MMGRLLGGGHTMTTVNKLLEEYIESLRVQNNVLCEINEVLLNQQKLAQQDGWNDLFDLFDKIKTLMNTKETLKKESDELSKKIINLLGIETFDKRVLNNIPPDYTTFILTEINKMRVNLERGNQITLENELLFKKIKDQK